MVGLQSLDLPIGVRIPVSQLNINALYSEFKAFEMISNGHESLSYLSFCVPLFRIFRSKPVKCRKVF